MANGASATAVAATGDVACKEPALFRIAGTGFARAERLYDQGLNWIKRTVKASRNGFERRGSLDHTRKNIDASSPARELTR
jgi:hypothetical protein